MRDSLVVEKPHSKGLCSSRSNKFFIEKIFPTNKSKTESLSVNTKVEKKI